MCAKCDWITDLFITLLTNLLFYFIILSVSCIICVFMCVISIKFEYVFILSLNLIIKSNIADCDRPGL